MRMDHIFPPNLHFHLLLTERNEQVFHQSPVQESSVLIHPGDFQTGELTYLHQRSQRRSNQSFIHIQIKKHVQKISYLTVFGHIAGRQQNLTFFPTIEIYAEIYFFHDFKLIELS